MSTNQKIFCSKCGAEMDLNQRNCLKCGQLNYQNPANQYMEKYKGNEEDKSQVYVIGEGGFGSGERASERLTDNMGDVRVCSAVNILLYLLGIIIIFFINFSSGNVWGSIVQSDFSILALLYSISFIFFYSMQVLFMKANHSWWSAIIPGYNIFVLVDIVFSNGWFFFLLLIPVVNIVFLFALLYNLGKVFDKNKTLTLLFFPVMVVVIAFDSVTKYNGTVYVSRKNGHDASIVFYKWNRLVLRLVLLFISFFAIVFGYKNIDVFVRVYDRIVTRDFTIDAKNIINDAKSSLESELYICSNGRDITEQDVYYVTFNNAGDYFRSSKVSTSSLTDMPYSGYIKVDNNKGKFYITLTDTVYSFTDVDEDLVRKATVEKGNIEMPDAPEHVICTWR